VKRLPWLLGGALALVAASAFAQALKPWTGGAPAPLELSDAEGTAHRLADYRGKVVLVNFWATWCVPCREEMPSIEALRQAMEGKPFVVLAVNVGEGARVARAFAQKLTLGFPLLLDRDTRTAKAWNARVLPASYLIGPDGTIRYSYLGELDWSSADVRARVEAMLPKNPDRKVSR
jgi:thiol-disulfide isomerase/thioredoxin